MSFLAGALLLSLLTILVLFIFRPYLRPGFAGGYDTLIHFFKVAQVKDMVARYGTYIDWNDQWYAGYHQFLFYPPLFYPLAVLAELFINNLEITSKAMVVAAVVFSGFSAYLLAYNTLPATDRIWRRSLGAFTSAVSYALSPALLSFIVTRGKYPDYYAIAFAPLCFVLLVRWLKSDRRTIPLGFALALSIMLLLHIDTAVTLALASLIYSVLYLKASLCEKARLFNPDYYRPMALLGLSLILFAGLTAFFWLPYLTQIKTLGALEQLYPSRAPLPLSVFARSHLINGISRYPGMIVLVLALLPLALRKLRPAVWTWFTLMITGFGLSLMPYTPIATSLPSVNTLFYRSGIVLAILAVSVMVGITIYSLITLNWRQRLDKHLPKWLATALEASLPTLFVLAVVVVIIFDFSFISGSVKTSKWFKGEVHQVVSSLSKAKQIDGGRVLVLASPIAEYTFLPALIGKPIVNGYEAQAARMSVDIEIIKREMAKGESESFVLTKLDQLNVQFLLIDRIDYHKQLDRLLATKRFTTIFSGNYYRILEHRPPGFVQPVKPILVIGSNSAYPVQALSPTTGIGFVKGGNLIDDYSSEELSKYQLVVLYNFEAHNVNVAQETLEKYLKQGGRLIVAMDGSLSNLLPDQTFLGVKPNTNEFAKKSKVKVTAGMPVKFSTLNNRDGRWSGTFYRGLDDVWLTVEGQYPVLGTRRIGKGEALFVGYNLFYHAIYEDNRTEAELLQTAAKRLLQNDRVALRYSRVSSRPGKISFDVDPSQPTWTMVSMSWSPYWVAYVDGKGVPTRSYENLLALYLPSGKHRVDLVYQLTPVHKIGLAITAFALLFLLLTGSIRLRNEWSDPSAPMRLSLRNSLRRLP